MYLNCSPGPGAEDASMTRYRVRFIAVDHNAEAKAALSRAGVHRAAHRIRGMPAIYHGDSIIYRIKRL